MILKEAWYEEIEKSPDALRALRGLRERVQRRDEDAVIPYLKTLYNLDKLEAPLPELSWLKDKVAVLESQIVDRFEEPVMIGSLIGSHIIPREREDLRAIYSNVERATRVVVSLTEGGRLPLSEWVIQATADLLEYSKNVPGLVDKFQAAVDEATRIRDADPKAIEFKDDFEAEVEWLRDHLKEMDRLEIVKKKLEGIASSRDVVTDTDDEEEVNYEGDPDSAEDHLFQADGFLEMVGQEAHQALGFLITQGYPQYGDLPSESYIKDDFSKIVEHIDEAAAILSMTNREDVEKVIQEFKDSGGGKL